MGKNYDQPEYIDVKRKDKKNKERAIKEMKELASEQSFGVLATQGNKDCYNSLISFAVNEDFSEIFFASPIDTKKIDYIKENPNVSVLIDNRDQNPDSINDILALTAMGQAKIMNTDKKAIAKALVEKHHYLEEFIDAETTAVVRIKVSNYYYVSSFQEVVEWKPGHE